jgi:hypothetical protein
MPLGFATKHSTSKSPKEWPRNEMAYCTIRIQTPDFKFDHLCEKIKEKMESDYPSIEQVESTFDQSVVWVDESGSSARDSFPFTESKSKKFSPISGDETLRGAIQNKSSIVLDLVQQSTSAEDEDSCSDSGSEQQQKTKKALFLDLLVWTKPKKTKNKRVAPKKKTAKGDYDSVKFELMPLVEKMKDGTYKTSSLSPIGCFFISKVELESLKLGQMRHRIAEYVTEKRVDSYARVTFDGDDCTWNEEKG